MGREDENRERKVGFKVRETAEESIVLVLFDGRVYGPSGSTRSMRLIRMILDEITIIISRQEEKRTPESCM